MTYPIDRLNPQPPGFGYCARCPYRETAPAGLCFACAARTMQAPLQRPCPVCDLPTENGCGNPVCSWDDRFFEWSSAVAMRTGVVERAINLYKYEERKGWAIVFGRVLVGHLDAHPDQFADFDAIIPSPTFIGPGGRSWDHTRMILERAAEAADDGRWPFDLADPPLVVKTALTTPFVGKRWKQRFEIARTELRRALSVPDPASVRRKSILVFDDVFTDGLALNEVARALLRLGGAVRVCGVTLARQPFRGAPSS